MLLRLLNTVKFADTESNYQISCYRIFMWLIQLQRIIQVNHIATNLDKPKAPLDILSSNGILRPATTFNCENFL